jgi:hypothetical protein
MSYIDKIEVVFLLTKKAEVVFLFTKKLMSSSFLQKIWGYLPFYKKVEVIFLFTKKLRSSPFSQKVEVVFLFTKKLRLSSINKKWGCLPFLAKQTLFKCFGLHLKSIWKLFRVGGWWVAGTKVIIRLGINSICLDEKSGFDGHFIWYLLARAVCVHCHGTKCPLLTALFLYSLSFFLSPRRVLFSQKELS